MSRLARWLFLQRMKIGREQARSIARAEIENRGFPWVEPVKVFRNYGNWSVVTGLDRRTIQRLRNRHFEPRPGTEKILIRVAGGWARQQLLAQRVTAPRSDVLACRAWLNHSG